MFSAYQDEILTYENKHKPIFTILEGAVRSGKTYLDLFLWLMHIQSFKNKNYKFIMTGYSIPSLKANALDDMTELFDIDTTLDKNNTFKLLGNKIHCFGTNKVDSYKAMRGMTAYGWYGNEVTLSHQNSIKEAIKRNSGPGFRIFWDTNPDHPQHPIKVEYIDRDGEKLESGREQVKSWHFVLDHNEYLSLEYKENLKKITPKGMWYDRDILGLWVAAEGMIYKVFNYSKHVISQMETVFIAKGESAFKYYVAGVDWGYDHLGVIGVYGADGDGNYTRLYEVAETGKTPDWWLEQGRDISKKHKGIIFYADPSRADNIEFWRKNDLNIKPAQNAVFEGITHVAGLYHKDKIKIVKEKNANHLTEIFIYVWKDSIKEEPVKKNDDSMDTERYALFSDYKNNLSMTQELSQYSVSDIFK